MHAQVGDQGAGAHVHRCLPGQQRVAQDARLHLHHVKTALRQRHAQHLGGAGLAALQLRQFGALHAGRLRQQRGLARLEGRLGVLLQARQPAQQRLVGRRRVQPLDGHAATGGRTRQVGLHVTQRERQHRIGPGLDDAEAAARKFGQRRQAARGHRQWKCRGIGQRTAGVVAQVGRQREREARVLRQRRGKTQLLDPFVVAGCQGLQRLALRRLQPRGQRRRARHRRIELQQQRPQRQAGRLRVFALAAEFGQETRPHLPLETLLAARDELWQPCRGYARAPHQAHAGSGREGPLAGQQQHVTRVGIAPALAQQRLARRALHQHHR